MPINVPDLAADSRRTLLDDVIPFWLRHGMDREHGGILTCLDRSGEVIDTDKSVWFQGRAGWMFAMLYPIDLHPSTHGDDYIDIPSLPFQIPLGALIPIRMRNLLPACKNIGTTH